MRRAMDRGRSPREHHTEVEGWMKEDIAIEE